jgi:hypothetical protein
MKNILPSIKVVGIILIAILIGCGFLFVSVYFWSENTYNRNPSRCSLLPNEFTASELAGTWAAGWPSHTDTLVIKADGTYKQIIHIDSISRPPIDYESDWLSWHVEYSENKIAYLHLDGMRFCGMNDEIPCEQRNSDGYDFCQNKSIQMSNEGILIVLAGHDDQLPGTKVPGYHIHLDYPMGSENSWSYSLQRP